MDKNKRFCWPVRPVADPQNCIVGKHYRFAVLTDRLIRMEYDPEGIFEDRASQTVFYRDLPTCEYSVSREGGVLTIHTGALLLTYQEESAFAADSLSVQLLLEPASKWNFGESFETLGGTCKTLDGVDGACHRAALDCGATTIGVVANPLPAITPATHTHLAEDMIARGGAIVTELNSQCKQNGRYYIPRNRIIAAMTAGTVVVESPETGGSLSTAAFADGYNRSVMAVPGRITDSNSRGCNLLIRNRRAQAVLSGRDIAAELMWELGLEPQGPERERQPLTEDEERLMVLFDSDPLTIDQLQERSGLSLGELSLTLMTLELSGAIRQLPGNRYEKLL